jgi:hypothetical protein
MIARDPFRTRHGLAVVVTAGVAWFVVAAAAPASGATFYASHVEQAVVGSPAQDGFGDANEALGAPSGRGSVGSASEGSTSVYNLGVGGSLTRHRRRGPHDAPGHRRRAGGRLHRFR